MATDEERREIAELLRKAREKDNQPTDDYGQLCELKLRCGRDSLVTRIDLYELLADLIGTEPERTCHDANNHEENGFTCSACGEWCPIDEPSYCPNCGAKVEDYGA